MTNCTLQLNEKLHLSVNKLICIGFYQQGFIYCNSAITHSQIYKCLNQCLSTGFSISIYIHPIKLKLYIYLQFNCYLQTNTNGSNSGQCYHILLKNLRALIVVYGFMLSSRNIKDSLGYSHTWKPQSYSGSSPSLAPTSPCFSPGLYFALNKTDLRSSPSDTVVVCAPFPHTVLALHHSTAASATTSSCQNYHKSCSILVVNIFLKHLHINSKYITQIAP